MHFNRTVLLDKTRKALNPFSPSCIAKFSKLEPIFSIEKGWENFAFNLQKFALFNQFSFSHYHMSYFVCAM